MARETLLDLSTLVENRPAFLVDGKLYHLLSPEELSLAQSLQFQAWGKEIEALGQSGDTLQLEVLVEQVAKAALADVPQGVFDRLSSSQLMDLVQLFSTLLLQHRLQLAGAIAKQVTRSTGANTSPGSRSSSAATPTPGTATSPQGS